MSVAVWLTNYASEKYLGDAILSVLKQSYKDLTLYIADNHSPGVRVAEILQGFATEKRVVVLDVPKGLAGIPLMKFCWDYLSEHGTHDYTITLGGHDAWDQDTFLETMVARISEKRQEPVSLVFADTWQMDKDSRVVARYGDIMQTVQSSAYALMPQFVIMGVNSPHFFGLWNEKIRRRIKVRHCCSGFDHLVVAEAVLHGSILFEPNVRFLIRGPAEGDTLQKYGERHLSKEDREAGPLDFLHQVEWCQYLVEVAAGNVPAPSRDIYGPFLIASMFCTYFALRGHNLYICKGAMERFQKSTEFQNIWAAAKHIEKTVKTLVETAKPIP